MRTRYLPIVLVAAALAAAGCGSAGGAPGSPADGHVPAGGGAQSPASAPATSVARPALPTSPSAHPMPQPTSASGLIVLHDPGAVTGTLTGPCRAGDQGQLPDPRCTPGGIDPAVTQANIHSTICVSGYTATVRPPEAQTEAFKFDDAYPAYGIPAGTATELDHLVPLELGGDNASANLWPEVPPTPNPKDSVEDALNAAVCSGRVSLASAQRAIAQDWQSAEARLGLGTQPPPSPVPAPAPTTAAPPALSCSASVSTSSPADYSTVDVTIRTTAGAAVTTVAHYKTTNHQKSGVADASGVAVIAYYISGATPGYTVVVSVTASAGSRSASCSTSFTPVP